MHAPTLPSRLRPLLPAVLALSLAACNDDDGDDSFVLRTATQAADETAPLVVAGNWLVYFASEGESGPAGTDLNGDGVLDDQVAFAVNLAGPSETNLGVAAFAAAIVGNEIYLVVDESEDEVDWSVPANGIGDIVLLHWSAGTGMVVFVDTLDARSVPVAVGSRLLYASAATPLGNETNLRRIEAATPTTPAIVANDVGALVAHLYGQRNGLVFAFLDENENGVPLNGDADATDTHVLALLDGTSASADLVPLGLALAGDVEPLAAVSLAASDWQAAFLVDEDAEGANLNAMSGRAGCAADADTMDRVLHAVRFTNSVAAAPVNTGIAGRDRVLATSTYVATLAGEDDAGCDLNVDGDSTDVVVRWFRTDIAESDTDTDLHAIATGTAGGSMGVALLGNRLVAVIDEAADDTDFDTQMGEASADHDLVAWIDPTLATPAWVFAHQAAQANVGTGVFDTLNRSEPFAGTSWMAPTATGGRLPLVFLEEVPGATNPNLGSLNTNLDCALVVKDNDKSDGLPVWADFEGGPTLDFDGIGYAVVKSNAGIEIAAGFAFFRVSEADDARDYNNDGQMNDVVLFLNPLTSCAPVPIATSSLVQGPAIATDGVAGAAFLSDEAMAGLDFNDDGDETDLVVRYFLF